jgi:hypothetical protein
MRDLHFQIVEINPVPSAAVSSNPRQQGHRRTAENYTTLVNKREKLSDAQRGHINHRLPSRCSFELSLRFLLLTQALYDFIHFFDIVRSQINRDVFSAELLVNFNLLQAAYSPKHSLFFIYSEELGIFFILSLKNWQQSVNSQDIFIPLFGEHPDKLHAAPAA